jgi:hypothetical protein
MNDYPPTQPATVTPTYSRTISKQQIIRAILLLVLIVAIVAGSLPSYLNNQWSWANFPKATNIKQVKSILSTGIQLPDWNTYLQQPTEVGSHRWSLQLIGKTPENPILVFLRPQTENPKKLDRLDKPEVDWEDIQGHTQKFTDTPERWVENLTYKLLKERLVEKLSLSTPNPANGNGSAAFKEEYMKGLSPWFQKQFIAEFEQQAQKSFQDNFAKPLEDSLGITFSAWVDKQLKNALDLGLSAWTKERFGQPKRDSQKDLKFTIDSDSQPFEVTARLFRAWNDKQTFAVVQWYARTDGGHYSPASWFWADRMAQLKDRRVSWIAVCLKIPIEPLGDLDKVESEITTLAVQVQKVLLETAFADDRRAEVSKSS